MVLCQWQLRTLYFPLFPRKGIQIIHLTSLGKIAPSSFIPTSVSLAFSSKGWNNALGCVCSPCRLGPRWANGLVFVDLGDNWETSQAPQPKTKRSASVTWQREMTWQVYYSVFRWATCRSADINKTSSSVHRQWFRVTAKLEPRWTHCATVVAHSCLNWHWFSVPAWESYLSWLAVAPWL